LSSLYIFSFIWSSVSPVSFFSPHIVALAPAPEIPLANHFTVSIGFIAIFNNQAAIFQALQGTLPSVHPA
jgi:hypothetical protein